MPVASGILQRKCVCGQHTIVGGECGQCRRNRQPLQRRAANQAETSLVPPMVHEALRSPGQPLDVATRALMEPRFGRDFSQVRVHSEGTPAKQAAPTLTNRHEPSEIEAEGVTDWRQSAAILHHRTTIEGEETPAKDRCAPLNAHKWTNAAPAAPVSTSASSRDPMGAGEGSEINTASFWGDVGIGAGAGAAVGAGIGFFAGGPLGAAIGGAAGGMVGAGIGAIVGSRSKKCSVKSGPTYSPSGTVPVVGSGGRKRAPFSFTASFDSGFLSGKQPSCCEVHQFIKWDTAFHTWRGGPPHSGFPTGTPANTWTEDRDASGKRYGHRSDSFSDPISGCGDEYKTGATRDQVNGNSYCGRDAPGGPASMTGQWQFRLDAVDTCDGNAVKASSSVITINW